MEAEPTPGCAEMMFVEGSADKLSTRASPMPPATKQEGLLGERRRAFHFVTSFDSN